MLIERTRSHDYLDFPMTCDRIAVVAKHYSINWHPVAGEFHEYFDRLDRLAGIQTQFPETCKRKRGSFCTHKKCKQALYVGERLLHHEARVNDVNYHFWLGDDGIE